MNRPLNLNVRQIFMQFPTRPLGDEFRKIGQSQPSWTFLVPNYFSPYTEQFYGSISLTEVQGDAFGPSHRRKSTLLLVQRPTELHRYVKRLERNLPVLAFNIYVNRSEFPQRESEEDEIEWLTRLTARTRGIAHEVLYVEQYIRLFDYSSAMLNPSRTQFSIPSTDAEDDLLCPRVEIERALRTVESQTDHKFTLEDFVQRSGAEVVQHYFRHWLKDFVVERDVCHRRTVQYLQSVDRGFLNELVTAALSQVYPDGVSSARYREQLLQRAAPVVQVEGVCHNQGVSDRDLIHYVAITVLERNGQH